MNADWQLVLDEIPLRFLFSKTPAQRRVLFAALEALKDDPYADHISEAETVWAGN